MADCETDILKPTFSIPNMNETSTDEIYSPITMKELNDCLTNN